MIAPAEVEQQLLKHPEVRDCVVMGVPDEIMGEEVRALVVGRGAAPQALRDFLAERLPAYMVPRYYSFVDAIPKTETEKVKRHELAAIDVATADLGSQGAGRTETNRRTA